MSEAAVLRELHKIAEELRLIRKELQRIAPIRKEIPDLETYFEQLEDDHK